MSKKEVIEYKCDVCGRTYPIERKKSLSENKPLREVMMPAKCYDCEGRNHSKGMSIVDMCEECYGKYWEYVQSRYDVSDCYGIEVKMKGEEHE